MLMCDSCGLAYHLQCLRPPLQVVPPGETWLCVACLRAGVTSETLGEPACRLGQAPNHQGVHQTQGCEKPGGQGGLQAR